jgi:hypothetical protein
MVVNQTRKSENSFDRAMHGQTLLGTGNTETNAVWIWDAQIVIGDNEIACILALRRLWLREKDMLEASITQPSISEHEMELVELLFMYVSGLFSGLVDTDMRVSRSFYQCVSGELMVGVKYQPKDVVKATHRKLGRTAPGRTSKDEWCSGRNSRSSRIPSITEMESRYKASTNYW